MQYKAGVVRCSIFSWCSMHDIIFKRSDVFVGISLGDKVVEFGSIEDSQRVLTRWCPCALQSLGTLWCWDIWKMEKGRRHWHYFNKCNGVHPVSFTGILNLCAIMMTLEDSSSIRNRRSILFPSTMLLCGIAFLTWHAQNLWDHGRAWRMFCKMGECAVVSWTAMISWLAECQQVQNALELFGQTQHKAKVCI
jgi:hypothetical protein